MSCVPLVLNFTRATKPQELLWIFAKIGFYTCTLETFRHACCFRHPPTVTFPHRHEGCNAPNVACRNCVYCTLQLLCSGNWAGWSSPSLYIPVIIYLQNYHFEWPCFAGWIMRYVPLPLPRCRWSCGAGAETCSTDQRAIKIASPIIRFHRFKKKVSCILIGCEEYDNFG
jgi:hypothetical protein